MSAVYWVYLVSVTITLWCVCCWIWKELTTNNIITLTDVIKIVSVLTICFIPILNTIGSAYMIISLIMSLIYDYVIILLNKCNHIIVYRKPIK